MSYTKICSHNHWTRSNISIRYVTKVASPQLFIPAARWHSIWLESPKLNFFVCAVSSVKVYDPLFLAEPTLTGISYLDTHSYSNIWTDFSFSTKCGTHLHLHVGHTCTCTWDTPALPTRGYFLPQSHGGCLDLTWWNDSLATTIA